jgi:hypothetical protein
MATAAAQSVTAVYAGAKTTGRNEDYWGNRRVALYRVQGPATAGADGIVFDPRAQGFDRPVASVFLTTHKCQSGNDYRATLYDFTAKTILVNDFTDSDAGTGDDMSALFIDVLVISE